MTNKRLLKRIRTQLIAVVESHEIDVSHRVNAAGILLKTLQTDSMPRNPSPAVRKAMAETATP